MSLNTEVESVSETAQVARVAFRPPPFWEKDPDLWFMQIESQFVVSGITVDHTKFHSVVSALDASVLSYVRDIISNPPPTDAYKAIKDRILSQFSQTETVKLKQLLQDLHIGDLRPSQLLMQMRHLADGKVNDDLLKPLWIQRLPLSSQQILSTCRDSLSDLSVIADKIHEVSGTSEIATVKTHFKSHGDEIEDLRNEIRELKHEVQRLSRRDRGKTHAKREGQSKSRERKQGLCWYHSHFNTKAQKCISPCSFSENERNRS